jgi:type I restriction enzyme S subunit
MNTELLKSKLLEAAFNGSLTHADTSKWKRVKLSNICSFDNGYAFASSDYKTEGTPLVRISNIQNNGVNLSDAVYIQGEYPERFLIHKGDLLIAMSGATTGKMGVYTTDDKAYLNQRVGKISIIDENFLLSGYRNYFIRKQTELILDLAYGAAQPNISGKQILELEIPLPPLPEQERIVSALEEGFAAIDAIAEAKANLSNTAEMLRSKILQAAFDGSLTGADISKWEHRQLREISTKIVDGDHNPPKGQKNPTPHIMLSSQNINENKFVAMNKVRYLSKEDFAMCHKRTNLTKGDVLLTSVGTVGRSCVHDSDEKYCFQRSVTIITPTINSYFLKYYFDSPAFQQMLLLGATGNAQKGFYLNQLKEVIIPLPPLAEQERIVAKIESLFTEIDKLSK